MIIPSISATGTESQSPVEFKKYGSIIIVPAKNKNVRAKDIIADTRPSEKAVNIDEANILVPISRKPMEYMPKPSSVTLFTALDVFPVKTSSTKPTENLEITNVIKEPTTINKILLLNTVFSCSFSPLPYL